MVQGYDGRSERGRRTPPNLHLCLLLQPPLTLPLPASTQSTDARDLLHLCLLLLLLLLLLPPPLPPPPPASTESTDARDLAC